MTDSSAKRGRWLQLIVDHNPCYLLSGVSMLLGCRLLNAALYTKAGDVRKLLVLLGTINLYELLLILLGLLLIRRKGFERDGRMLLGLEALFLVDITFTSGLISTIDPRWGALINSALLLLGGIKVWVILSALRAPMLARTWAFITLQLLFLLALPTTFKLIATPRQGTLPPLAVFAAWWAAATLPLIAGLLFTTRPPRPSPLPSIDPGMGIFYIILPFASLLVHLYSTAWVYSVDFALFLAAPIILALTVASVFVEPWIPHRHLRRIQALGLITSIAMSLNFTDTFTFNTYTLAAISWSPLRIMLAASATFLLYLFWRHRRAIHLLAATACIGAAFLGTSPPRILTSLQELARMAWEATQRTVPRTQSEWGIAAVTLSFLLLAAGACLSLKKHPTPQPPS